MAQTVKNLSAMWETWVRSLSWDDPLEEGMVTHSSILAWGIPMDRGAWRAAVRGVAKSRTQLSAARRFLPGARLSALHTFLFDPLNHPRAGAAVITIYR